LVLLAKLLFTVPSLQMRFAVFDSPLPIRTCESALRSFFNPCLEIVPLDSGCGCYWRNCLPASSSQMQFAIFDLPPLIRPRSPAASAFQFLLRGLSIRMTRFGAIGLIAFTVYLRECGLPTSIRGRSFLCVYFSIPLRWVAALDDRCGYYWTNRF
jgi:hypothetical protein